MSKRKKLIKKLLSKPKDFTFFETQTLLKSFGYDLTTKGKTSGSRAEFRNINGNRISIHKPHPGNELKPYQVNQMIDDLRKRGLL